MISKHHNNQFYLISQARYNTPHFHHLGQLKWQKYANYLPLFPLKTLS